MTPTTLTRPEPASTTPPPRRPHRPWLPIVLAVAAAIAALVAFLAVLDDDADVATDTTTTLEPATTAPATTEPVTTEPAPTTQTPSTRPQAITSEEAAGVVWPDPSTGPVYDTPKAAVAGFAEDLLGFADPVYGAFMQGDTRSGEIEVRGAEDGPVTTVGARQMSDGSWYVLFAATSEIEVIMPVPGMAIDHPLDVEGWGRGFEGQVRVAVYERGATTPLGEGFFTAGSGEDPVAFTGSVDWPNRGTGGWGVIVATTATGRDGSTWAATAFPVGFIGGD